jgi:hypothetical protein
MKRVTSKLLVLLVGGDASRGLRDVGNQVFGQFCVRDREARGGRMVKFPVKPEGTNLRPILIASAMCYKSSGRNGHKILRGFAGRPAKGEGTDRSLIFKPTVL